MNWISVKNKYPTPDEMVLTFSPINGYLIDYVMYFDDAKEHYVWSKSLGYAKHKVTHWMPLPDEPPTEDF